MEILFVYGNMYLVGGVQTWLARMASRLRAEGHTVRLLTRPQAEPWDATSSMLDLIAEDASVHYTDRHWFRPPGSPSEALGHPDVIFACNLEALLLAVQVQQRIAPRAKVVAGVFGPREYCWKASRLQRRWSQHLAERVVRRLPLENFMFSTDGMARETSNCLGRDLTPSPVLPLPIDTERLRPPPDRRVDRYKIASVARLVPYYPHHRLMMGVIRELRDQGHPFTYHAYGDGAQREELEAEVRREGLEDAVFFHGSVPYEQFAEAVSDAFAYIGLGTGLLEAAACGVPGLVAIDGQREPYCYGFIQDTVGNDVGGYVAGHAEYPISERILWLAGLPEAEYRRVAEGSRARAEEFGLPRLLPRFLGILEAASDFHCPISATDRALGRLDWLFEAVLLHLGAPDAMGTRHARRTS